MLLKSSQLGPINGKKLQYNTLKNRKWKSIRGKFDSLVKKEAPTGNYEIATNIERAKQIAENIAQKEVLGKSTWNDIESDEDDTSIESPKKGLKGTNLLKDTGSPRKPETKKRKIANVAEAIKEVGEAQKEQSFRTAGPTQQPLNQEVINLTNRIGSIEGDVRSLHGKLDRLFDHVSKK